MILQWPIRFWSIPRPISTVVKPRAQQLSVRSRSILHSYNPFSFSCFLFCRNCCSFFYIPLSFSLSLSLACSRSITSSTFRRWLKHSRTKRITARSLSDLYHLLVTNRQHFESGEPRWICLCEFHASLRYLYTSSIYRIQGFAADLVTRLND